MVSQGTAPKRPNHGYDAAPKCSAIKADGKRCRSFATSDGFCYRHSPNVSNEHKQRAWRLGGKTPNGHRSRMRMLPPRLQMLYEDLEQAWVQTAAGDMAPTRASALASLANAMRNVFNDSVLEQRITDLEKVAPDDDGEALMEDGDVH